MRVVFAHRLEALADVLAAHISATRSEDPLAGLHPITIWLGEPTMGVWLRRALAERMGHAAHWVLRPYQRGLDELSAKLDVRLATRARIELALLGRLADERLLEHPLLGPVRSYLDVAGGDGAARDRRRQQFARELAQRFSRYAATRPQMLRRWSRGEVEPEETWQSVLHEAVCDLGLLPLERLFDQRRLAHMELPDRIIALELPLENQALTVVLHRLSQSVDLSCLALNPCSEFWEDDVGVTGAPALLTRWAKLGRVRVKRHQELVNYAAEELYESNQEPESALQALQLDLQTLADPVTSEYDDHSILQCAAPSVRRELDWVARDIWSWIEAGVRPDQIAVVLPDRESQVYRTHLSAAFEEHHELAYGELDVPLSESSRVLEAVELLFILPMSAFSRSDLLRLITHPNVIAAAAPSDPADWMRWCESLSIVQGAERDAGTYVHDELYHWDQGLRRLALGRFSADPADNPEALHIDGRWYLPHGLAPEDHASAARLVALVRSLLADAQFARNTVQTVAEWARFFVMMVHTYAVAVGDRDEGDITRIVDTLSRLEEDDLADARVSHVAAAELVRARLQMLSSHRGPALAEGVVVGPLSGLASIPFEVVYLTGLGEGRFPPASDRSQLDLRHQNPKVDDVDRREEAQYRFLQRVLHTSRALRISWVGRDANTGAELAPAPTVDDLARTLEAHYLGEHLKCKSPALRRWDEASDEDPLAPAAARRERRVAQLRQKLESELGSVIDSPQALSQMLSPEQLPRLARTLGLPQLPDDLEAVSGTSVSVYALLRFLVDPVDGWTRAALRWSDSDLEEDPFARREEPFETGARDRVRLLHEVFCSLAPGQDMAEAYRLAARRTELAGRSPTGTFADAQTRRDLLLLKTWQDSLRARRFGVSPLVTTTEFGARSPVRGSAVSSHPALRLGADRQLIDLSGSTGPRAEQTTVVLKTGPRLFFKGMLQDELRGFVDHVLLCAAGIQTEASRSLVLYGDGQVHEVEYPAWPQNEALGWLTARCREMLEQTHAYDLPFTTVVTLERARTPAAQKRALATERRHRVYDPVRRRPPTPGLEQALTIVAERYAAFFQRRRELT